MCTVQAWHWCKKRITCPSDQEDGLQTARQYYLLVSRIEQIWNRARTTRITLNGLLSGKITIMPKIKKISNPSK